MGPKNYSAAHHLVRGIRRGLGVAGWPFVLVRQRDDEIGTRKVGCEISFLAELSYRQCFG